tara:strand:- start:925 stop:1224 length:300 start_codon:yes stop_codon:yes gene_type:complete
MYDICSSILAINPDARVSIIEEDFDRITWLYGTTPISKSDIQAKQAELKAAYDAKDYQRKRQPEYPTIGDQLDALYHADVFPTDMAAQLKAVKDKYAKE